MTLAATLAFALCAGAAPQPTALVVESIGDAPGVDLESVVSFVPSLAVRRIVDPARERALRCAGEPKCIASLFADQFVRVLVVVIEGGANVAVAIDVVDVDERRRLVRHFHEVDPNSRDPVRAIEEELLTALDDAGHPAHGVLLLDVTPGEAAATIDGNRLDLPRALVLPGVHRVHIESDDHEPAEVDVRITRGAETARQVALVPTEVSTTWLWIAAGAALVVAGGTAAVLLSSSSQDDGRRRLCQMPVGGAACDASP